MTNNENENVNNEFEKLAQQLGEEVDANEQVPADAVDVGEAAEIAASGDQQADEEQATEFNAQEVAELKAKVESLTEELARSRAESFNISQEYSAYVRRTKAEQAAYKEEGKAQVLTTLLGVLDDIYAAEQAGDLVGPFASIASKLRSTLQTNYGLEIYGEAGDTFDPQLHDALMAQPADVDVETVGQVLQPGYRLGEKILRPTKVIVHNPQ